MAVLSERHRYLYIMAPRTGCTAVGDHLVKQFDGRYLPAQDVRDEAGDIVVQRKHSTVAKLVDHDLLTRRQVRRLFVFTGVRNPFDSLASLWVKKRTSYQPLLDDPDSFVNRLPGFADDMRWIGEHTFSEWVERQYGHIDDNRRRHLYGPYLRGADFVMRFERLQQDFATAMHKVGIDDPAPIPLLNPTEGREDDYRVYYTPQARALIERVFAADLERFGYGFDDPGAVAPHPSPSPDRGRQTADTGQQPVHVGGVTPAPHTPVAGRDTGVLARYCPACRRESDHFEPGPDQRPDARCPRCGALERHRTLALVLDRLEPVLAASRAVVDVAPQAQVRRLLQARTSGDYIGIDLADTRRAHVLGDVCRLPFPDATFDVAVAVHVLEHVADDTGAMAELRRVLTDDGLAIVQVPQRRGHPTEEDADADADERTRRFGQADHVRWYGDDFEDRLRAADLHPTSLVSRDLADDEEARRWALVADEQLWLCAPGAAPRVRLDGEPLVTEQHALAGLRRLSAELVRVEARATRAETAAADLRRRLRRTEQLAEQRQARYERIAGHPVVRLARRARGAALRLRDRAR